MAITCNTPGQVQKLIDNEIEQGLQELRQTLFDPAWVQAAAKAVPSKRRHRNYDEPRNRYAEPMVVERQWMKYSSVLGVLRLLRLYCRLRRQMVRSDRSPRPVSLLRERPHFALALRVSGPSNCARLPRNQAEIGATTLEILDQLRRPSSVRSVRMPSRPSAGCAPRSSACSARLGSAGCGAIT